MHHYKLLNAGIELRLFVCSRVASELPCRQIKPTPAVHSHHALVEHILASGYIAMGFYKYV